MRGRPPITDRLHSCRWPRGRACCSDFAPLLAVPIIDTPARTNASPQGATRHNARAGTCPGITRARGCLCVSLTGYTPQAQRVTHFIAPWRPHRARTSSGITDPLQRLRAGVGTSAQAKESTRRSSSLRALFPDTGGAGYLRLFFHDTIVPRNAY